MQKPYSEPKFSIFDNSEKIEKWKNPRGYQKWGEKKTGRESTGNFVICLQFNFYQNRLKIKKVRAMSSWGAKSDFSPPGSAAVWVRPLK